MSTTSRIALALTLAFLLQAGRGARAGDHHAVHCPQCHHVCKLSIEKDKDEKHCWKIDVKPICIPRIKWPWESCHAPLKCAKVKYVKTLDKHEYECEKCKYVWTPVCAGPCGHGHAGHAGACGCAAQPAPVVLPGSQTDTPPAVSPGEDVPPPPPPVEANRDAAPDAPKQASFEQPARQSRALPMFIRTR